MQCGATRQGTATGIIRAMRADLPSRCRRGLARAAPFVAAVAGDAVNYSIGRAIGPRIFHASDQQGWFHKLLNRQHLERAHEFFERYGGKAVVLGRFVPIVRTFAPFVAGMGHMSYGYFFSYNVFGGLVWVFLFTLMGYFFGNLPFVQKNFELVIVAILLISVVPIVWEFFKARRESKREKAKVEQSSLDQSKEAETP